MRYLTQVRRRAGVTTVLSGLAGQAVVVVSGVLVARLLAVDDRGHLALMGLLPIVLCQLGGLGIPIAATYELAHRPSGARALASVLIRVLPVQTVVLVAIHIGLLVVLFHDADPRVWDAALVTIPAVPALLCHQLGLCVLQGQQRFGVYNVQRLFPLVAYAGVLLVVAVGGFGSLLACAITWTGAWFAAGAITISTAARGLRRSVGDDPVDSKSFFRFGRRALLGCIFPVEAFQVDQLIVGLMFSPAGLGLYVVAVAVTNAPRFVAHSIGIVAYPRIAAQADGRTAVRVLWRYFGIAMALSLPIVLVLELCVGWLIPLLFGEQYAGAVPIARLLMIGALFQAARRVLADAARGLGRPELGSRAEVVSWFVLVPAVVLLQPQGLEGIAGAMVITYGVSLGVLVLSVLLDGGRSATPGRDNDAIATDEGTMGTSGRGLPEEVSPSAAVGEASL